MAHQSLSKDLEYDAGSLEPKVNERGKIVATEVKDCVKIKDKVITRDSERIRKINKETQERLEGKQVDTRQEEKDVKEIDENDLAL